MEPEDSEPYWQEPATSTATSIQTTPTHPISWASIKYYPTTYA